MESGLNAVFSILAAMGVQTVIIAAVNKSQIEGLRESIREAKKSAGDSHRRIDALKDQIYKYIQHCRSR